MRINWYSVLPTVAALLGASWLITVLCNWGNIPVALHWLIITWFAVAMSLCLLFIGLVAYIGADVYSARRRRKSAHSERLRQLDADFVRRVQTLVQGVEVDLDRPLSADDES